MASISNYMGNYLTMNIDENVPISIEFDNFYELLPNFFMPIRELERVSSIEIHTREINSLEIYDIILYWPDYGSDGGPAHIKYKTNIKDLQSARLILIMLISEIDKRISKYLKFKLS